MKRLPAFLMLCTLVYGVEAAGRIDEPQLRALDEKCEAARAAALSPIREGMARRCVQERPYLADPEEQCRLEMSTYGDTFSGARGAAIRGMFYDLPECVAAAAAWKEWEASRPWKD